MRYAIVFVATIPVGCTGTHPEQREPEPVHEGKTLSEWLEQMRERDTTRGNRAVEALAKIGKPAVPALIVVLEDEDLGRRFLPACERAADALGGMGPDAKAAIPALTRVFKWGAGDYIGGGSLLSEASARALAEIERPDYSTLIQALKDGHEAVRRKAADALLIEAQRKQDMKVAVPALIAALEDRSSNVRCSAAASFWSIDPDAAKPAIPGLVRALKDEDERVPENAAGVLGKLRASDKEVVSALATALKDKRVAVWRAASSSLAKIGEPAVSALVEALKDKDACARLRAVKTLEEMGPIARPAVTALLEALKDKDEHVRTHAREALKQIDRQAAREAGIE